MVELEYLFLLYLCPILYHFFHESLKSQREILIDY